MGLCRRARRSFQTDGLAVFRDLFRHNAQFRNTYLVALSQSAVLGFYDPLLALFLKGQGFAAGTFGVIVSCTAAGAIGAGIVFRRIFPLGASGLGPASLAGFGMTVLLPGLFALTHWPLPLYGLYVSWLANGFFYGMSSMLFMVTLQREAPSQAIGVVVSFHVPPSWPCWSPRPSWGRGEPGMSASPPCLFCPGRWQSPQGFCCTRCCAGDHPNRPPPEAGIGRDLPGSVAGEGHAAVDPAPGPSVLHRRIGCTMRPNRDAPGVPNALPSAYPLTL